MALILVSFPFAGQSFFLTPTASAATCENLDITGVSAIGYEGRNRPDNVIDDRLTTRWSHFGSGSWITADLGEQKMVCSADVAWYKGFGRTNEFSVSVSTDGSSFDTVYSGESSGRTLSSEKYSFAETPARYVRVTFEDSSDGLWASITEIDVYGYAPMSDTTAPSISITSPADGSTLVQQTGRVSVEGTASDNQKVEKVEVRIDDGTYALATPRAAGDWSSWTIAVDIAAGSHRVLSRATDSSGNQDWSDVNINLTIDSAEDTTVPSVQILDPAENSDVAVADGTITITGTASDGQSGVDIVEVRVDSGSYVAATPRAAGDWSEWSVTLPITAGERRLVPRATDNAGNQAWNSIYVTVATGSSSPPPPSSGDGALDAFGIEKMYPTKQGGNEWYVNMNDPDSDPLFRNLPAMTRQSDGSWQVDGGSRGQVRMEAWSPSNEKWLNVEITEYAKIVGGTNHLLQMYSRGGHHTSSNECLGSAYKARLYGDGEARWVKEVTHPAYASNRGSVEATNEPLEDRWVGFKAVIYNFVENGKTYVRMESYIDDDVTDSNGNLVIRNNWELASVVEDRGGWSTSDSDFQTGCPVLNKDSTQSSRQRDEILNTGGGTDTQNIAAWRSDGLTWNFKYLSVREIQAP